MPELMSVSNVSNLDSEDGLGPLDLIVFNESDLPDLESVSNDVPKDKSDFMSEPESWPGPDKDRSTYLYGIINACYLFSDPIEKWFRWYLNHAKEKAGDLLDQKDTEDNMLRMMQSIKDETHRKARDILVP